jgi:hypothetical protein
MPLKNYTTTVSAIKTIGEIQEKLVEHGASSIMVNYNLNKEPESLSFQIKASHGMLSFRLPANITKVEKIMIGRRAKPLNSYQYGYNDTIDKIHKQAMNTAWRTIKDWVESQLAMVETEMVSLEEIFLPYYLLNNGQTLFENMADSHFLLQEGKQ